MADPRQTVEGIRAFLRSDVPAVSSALTALALDYAEMCREANERLRRCADFLQEGLVGEAVHFAAERPPLVELVSELQFQEWGEWDRNCGNLGLVRPAALSMETVKRLGDAARSNEPLRELLARHRQLALARAPLAERLSVLRQLTGADPKSPIWRRDAAEMERVRLTELRNQATSHISSGDNQAIEKLLAEINETGWSAAIPAELRANLERAAAQARESRAVAQLRALAPKVREAYAAMSYRQCKQVFAQWGKIVKESRIAVPPDLRQEILPLAHWLDAEDDRLAREQKFKVACLALEQGIATHVGMEALKVLYRDAAAADADLPVALEAAYRKRVADMRREEQLEKRRQYLLTFALVAAIALVLAALAVVIISSAKH